MDKGLSAIENGLLPNMTSALVAATFVHLFLNTSASDGVADAKAKAQIIVAYGFVMHSLVTEIGFAKLFGMQKSVVKEVPKMASSEPAAVEAPTKSKKSKKAKKQE